MTYWGTRILAETRSAMENKDEMLKMDSDRLVEEMVGLTNAKEH